MKLDTSMLVVTLYNLMENIILSMQAVVSFQIYK